MNSDDIFLKSIRVEVLKLNSNCQEVLTSVPVEDRVEGSIAFTKKLNIPTEKTLGMI